MPDDTCTILANGMRLQGWTSVQVNRSCETIPNTFTISAADPGDAIAATLPEGSPCEIILGQDTVLTGYIDTVAVSVTATSHDVTLTGRGKTSDLVDCTCIPLVNDGGVENLSFAGLDLEAIAGALCTPYGVKYSVRSDLTPLVNQPGASGGRLPYFSANFTDTPAAALTELARFYGLLMYESAEGELVFERGGQTPAAGGFVYAQNIMSHRFSRSMAERFSEIRVYTTATAEALNADLPNVTLQATQNDPNVTRFRRHAQIGASPIVGFGAQEAAWEIARLAGRSRTLSVTVDGWRDPSGAPWAPNTKATVSIPNVPTGSGWVIADVSYLDDPEEGPRTDISLLPAEAFSVEPIVLVKDGADFLPVLAQQNAAKAS